MIINCKNLLNWGREITEITITLESYMGRKKYKTLKENDNRKNLSMKTI